VDNFASVKTSEESAEACSERRGRRPTEFIPGGQSTEISRGLTDKRLIKAQASSSHLPKPLRVQTIRRIMKKRWKSSRQCAILSASLDSRFFLWIINLAVSG
jgi:hypothetical protein